MLAVLMAILLAGLAYASPPYYATFNRDQIIEYAPDESALLRIWMVYIGQGDAIFIQFPTRFPSDAGEPVEMLVDGGPTLTPAARKAMTETKHVLIETDGRRFRRVEVADPTLPPPKVGSVSRGDGTHWIDAAEKPGSCLPC